MASQSREQFIRRVMSGAECTVGASMLRAVLSAAEPYYAAGMWVRNKMFDAGWRKQNRLDRPAISVGNITTGGTGKTPVVQWIVRQLVSMERRPAILLRGYKGGRLRRRESETLQSETLESKSPEMRTTRFAKPQAALAGQGDEAELLARSLNVPVRANPDRVAAARQLLEEHPEIDAIVLDDGFQHRRAARDLDLVLIDATNPFGYGHILPRGMLREPLGGLMRASAFVITRSNQVNPEAVAQIERTLRQYNHAAPIFHANHAIVNFAAGEEDHSPMMLQGKKIVALCGIGNPGNFHRQLLDLGAIDGGLIALDDHHDYSADEIQRLSDRALAAGAEVIITTEKDWVKIEPLAGQCKLPIWRAQLEVQLPADHAMQFTEMIRAVVSRRSSDPLSKD